MQFKINLNLNDKKKKKPQKWVCNREPEIELRYRDRETRKERTKENGRKNDVQKMTLMSEVVFEG